MYLQSIKSVKHNAAKSVNRPILKESQHIGFVVFIIYSSMLALLLSCTSLSHKLCAQYCRSGIVMPFISVAGTLVGESVSNSEMEFLDFNLTKDSSLLLHAIRSVSTSGKPRLYYGFKNTYKKIRETRKLECMPTGMLKDLNVHNITKMYNSKKHRNLNLRMYCMCSKLPTHPHYI